MTAKKHKKASAKTTKAKSVGPPACPARVYSEVDPKIEAMVEEIIGRVADKWTMLVLEALEEHGTLRFTQLGRIVSGISQKMLTQTVRQMERDGLVKRTVHPVIPPRVEYALTPLGSGLSEAFCGVWIWVEKHWDEIAQARDRFERSQQQSI